MNLYPTRNHTCRYLSVAGLLYITAIGSLLILSLVCADSPSVSISPTASPVLVTPKVEEHVELDDSEPGEQNIIALACVQP